VAPAQLGRTARESRGSVQRRQFPARKRRVVAEESRTARAGRPPKVSPLGPSGRRGKTTRSRRSRELAPGSRASGAYPNPNSKPFSQWAQGATASRAKSAFTQRFAAGPGRSSSSGPRSPIVSAIKGPRPRAGAVEAGDDLQIKNGGVWMDAEMGPFVLLSEW